jgi:hypothetical protein
MSTKNTLSRREQRALEDLLIEHKAEAEAGKWTLVKFAEFATQRLRRPVTAANIAGCARNMEVKFNNHFNKVGGSMFQLRACIRILATELINTKARLGDIISPSLQGLADGLQTQQSEQEEVK